MSKSCPSCGAEAQQGARYCRKCGGPLRITAGNNNGSDIVSPQAATVPLTDDGRATDGLAPDDPHRIAPETARVNRAELDAILRAQRPAGHADNHHETTLMQSARDVAGDAQRDGGDDSHDTSELERTIPAADGFGFETVPALNTADEELTISVPRVARPFDGRESPVRVESLSSVAPPMHATEALTPPSPPQVSPAAPPAMQSRRNRWPLIVGACAALLVLCAGVWLSLSYLRRPAPTEVSTVLPTAPPDAKQLFDEKLAQAETLLASGDMDGAIARLREANELDPANTSAHRRLAEILMDGGARREAIAEFRAVVQNSPNDFTAWRALASAQFAEGLHRDAAESYRRLVALTGDETADPQDLLSYADAMRLSGRTEEAHALYRRLASLATPETAETAELARRRIAELVQPSPTPTATPRPGEVAATNNEQGQESNAVSPASAPPPTQQAQPVQPPAPAPTQAARPADPPPADRYRRGVELWPSNRAAAVTEFLAAARSGSADANYYLGLNLVEGKDMRNLKRAEVVAALQYFQIAQRGQFAAQSRRYAQQLEKEFDRLRKQ